jgi:hypothetical protein
MRTPRRSILKRSVILLAAAALTGAWAGCQVDNNGDSGSSGQTTSSSGAGGSGGVGGGGTTPQTLTVAQFNLREFSTDKLIDPADEQASAAAEVIARFKPDIISINELQFDIQGLPTASMPGAPSGTTYGNFNGNGDDNTKRLADRIAAIDPEATYSNTLLTIGNSGFYWEGDDLGLDWYILRGWGEWRGRHNTGILSRYPILYDQVRVITDVAWDSLPENNIALMKSETGIDVPPGFPVFEKSLNVVPVQVGEQVIYVVLLHPVAPAFDPINVYRNSDELRALAMFLDGTLPGVEPLPEGAKFFVVGDLNADPDEGDSLPGAIQRIIEHPLLAVSYPAGAGTKGQNGEYNSYLSGCGHDDGTMVGDPADRWQMQLDYVLPSATIGLAKSSILFWPDHVSERDDFDLSCRASDHKFLMVEVEL